MPKFKIARKLVDRLTLVSRERLSGMMISRAFNTQEIEEKRFDAANAELAKNSLFVNRVMAFMIPTMMLVMNGVSLLIIWIGAEQVGQSAMRVGDMMAFMQYAMQIVMAFLMMSMIFVMLPSAAVSADRVAGHPRRRKLTHRDPEEPASFDGAFAGTVEFRDVCFRYPNAEEDALHGVSFTARPGQTTAIIGATGAGKSSIVNLVPRFYDVSSGSVLVGGIDVRRLGQGELREKIGYAPQKASLFSGTIDSNLRFADKDASSEDIDSAAAIAQVAEFIDSSPQGAATAIAQGGDNVSGGQRQRLSIARALVKRQAILIFDDCFSALDFKTDAALRKALKAKRKESTIIIVTQRVATVMQADQVIVLDEGKVVGIGDHASLMKGCETYREIAESQLSQEEITMSDANTNRNGGRGGGFGGGHGMSMSDEKARNFKATMRKLLAYLGRYKIAIVAVFVISFASTLFSVAGPKILGMATTKLFEGVMSMAAGRGGIDFGFIGRIVLITLGLYLLSAAFVYVQGWIMAGISTKISYRLRKDISEKMDRLPLRYFDHTTHGEILSRMTNDVDVINQTLSQSLMQLISSTVTVAGVIAMMLSINWLLTLVALVIMPVSLLFVTTLVKKSQKIFKEQQACLGQINGHVEEMYGGHLVIKAFNAERRSIEVFGGP